MSMRASLTNRAAFAQPHPILRLELDDRFGEPIAVRDFEPADYLKNPSEASRLLGPSASTEAEILIVNPGQDAVGYRLDVCLRESPAHAALRTRPGLNRWRISRSAHTGWTAARSSRRWRASPTCRFAACAAAWARRSRPAKCSPPIRGSGTPGNRGAGGTTRTSPNRASCRSPEAIRQMMADAARRNVDAGAQIIDINMGCPAKKVCNKDAGSALLRDETLVAAILEATVRAAGVPVTLKIRTGWSEERRNGVAIARIAESAGVQALAVHGRTRACRFDGEAEYETIAAIKQSVRIPVIANGDIDSPAQGRRRCCERRARTASWSAARHRDGRGYSAKSRRRSPAGPVPAEPLRPKCVISSRLTCAICTPSTA